MTEQPPKKPTLQHVPAILTGAAALIASLTAVYVNLRGDRAPSTPQAVVASAPASARGASEATPARETPKSVDRFTVAVDRIAVENDGSPGTTDWRFTVEADDDALFAFQQDDLDDTGGRNVAVPKDATGVLRMDGRNGVRVTIKGWRGRLFGLGRAPDATGEGRLSASGAVGAIRVAAAKPEEGAFVFHLSADPAR
ncbi:hypothetical protein LF41_563 [Lysobacter dokdonensis DS-58]|uniref:Uncharacterized protein n=1 Tax=Lysobacter dokdonensis DS-58 TaxID=1300345 RepID=A0A0A2WFL2_9GAMM|nr:hypothetical protein [Lysobacter dokdonensis]KGQ18538.1 hypothetical protein LF41_563 [Lysobacter dokdonensis DS-58]